MLNQSDEAWLRGAHPDLIREGDTVEGTITFTAAYHQPTNRFVILANQDTAPSGAVTLAGTFHIRIQERTDTTDSRLPALYIQGIDPAPERHFNQRDKSACLCSPFDEDDFLQPEFQFRPYLEQLVVPFLFGQNFYSSQERWPWPEYAHGATGVLEAYSTFADPSRAQQCLQKLTKDRTWPYIRSTLQQKPHVKGHTPCFCLSLNHIRRCHPMALQGALQLQKDLRAQGISIP